MPRFLRIVAAALIAALALSAGPAAAEEILSYDVGVNVLKDGALDVTETIRVTVQGNQIKHGIIRDFPVEYREKDGRTSLATFKLLDVTRNGKPENYRTSRKGPYISIRIGRGDVLLPAPSEQTYRIHYRTQGQLRAYQGYDELYWNVTGNDWTFPIDAASVTIHLPAGTKILQHAGYTGPRGASGSDFEVTQAGDGVFSAHTTARLGPRQGFTVAIGWPKGVVQVPPVQYGVAGMNGMVAPMTWAGYRLGPVMAVLGTLIGAFLLLLGWVRVGRDPQGGAVYPQFEPPAGLSPAAVRYIKRYGFDPRCLTAAIVSMAVKGALKIVEQDSSGLFGGVEYRLLPLGQRNRGLSAGERDAYDALFPAGGEVTLTADRTNGAKVDMARSELRSRLWDEHYGASFSRNWLYTLGGILLGVAVSLGLIGYVERWNPLPMLQWGIAALVAGFVLYAVVGLWTWIGELRRGAGLTLRRVVRLVPVLVVLAIIAVQFSIVASIPDLAGHIRLDPVFVAAGAAFGVVAVLFHYLMAAPSKAGRKLLDQIEGFEMYMRTAEEERLGILNPPEHTPELFERLLPYAIALGLAHEWSAKFASVLAAAAMAPTWYVGTRGFDVDHLDRSFSHAVSSTSVPSRGGSGSGGGGFSGGGGGGGGGSGW